MDLLGRFSRRAPGVRGGRGEFDWANVQTDKYRENYLGHSLMAPVVRRGGGGDNTNWYSKEEGDSNPNDRKHELDMVKQAERAALEMALGGPGGGVNYSPVVPQDTRRRHHHHHHSDSKRLKSSDDDRYNKHRHSHHHHHHRRRSQSPEDRHSRRHGRRRRRSSSPSPRRR